MNRVRSRILVLVLSLAAVVLAATWIAIGQYREIHYVPLDVQPITDEAMEPEGAESTETIKSTENAESTQSTQGSQSTQSAVRNQSSQSSKIVKRKPILEPVTGNTTNILVCGLDGSKKLTDVIMLARFDVEGGKVNVISIPRDTFVGQGYQSGKINEVYAHPTNQKDGIAELKDIIESQFCLRVDSYAMVTLEGFRKIVDSLGGVEVNIPYQIDYTTDRVIYEGKQTLTGEKAEWLIRYRQGYKNGDLGRISTQQVFMQSALSTARKAGKLKCLQLVLENYREIKTDLSLGRLTSLASAAFSMDQNSIKMFTLPVYTAANGKYSVAEVNRKAFATILKDHFGAGETFTADMLDTRYAS